MIPAWLTDLVVDPGTWRVMARFVFLVGPVFVLIAFVRSLAVFVDVALRRRGLPLQIVDLVRRWSIRVAAMLITLAWAQYVWPAHLALPGFSPFETRAALAVIAPFLWDAARFTWRLFAWAANQYRKRKDLEPLPTLQELEDDLAGRTALGKFVQRTAARDADQ